MGGHLHLRSALSSRSVINHATGIVMSTQHCTLDQAFDPAGAPAFDDLEVEGRSSPTVRTVNGRPSLWVTTNVKGPMTSHAKIALCRIGAMYRRGGPRYVWSTSYSSSSSGKDITRRPC